MGEESMVERAARAICIASGYEPETWAYDENLRDRCREQARAAIEAMRDPPPRVICAALRAMRADDLDPVDAEVKAGWNAGIDAALQEPTSKESLQVQKEMEG